MRPTNGIGERLALYRRAAGLSARELADITGYGLTRGVISNIESGRKTDVTVDQMLALASALAVPPSALALDLMRPNALSFVQDGAERGVAQRNVDIIDWFEGTDDPTRTPSTKASAVAYLILKLVREMQSLQRIVTELGGEEKLPPELRAQLTRARREMQAIGIDDSIEDLDEAILAAAEKHG